MSTEVRAVPLARERRWRQGSLLLTTVLLGLLLFRASPPPLRSDAINLVLGDAALQAAYGERPPADLSEDERIRTHLEYVLALLRRRPLDTVPPGLRAARLRQLERLESYLRAGVFPRNDDHPDARRPTFIDARGRICAVGFLLERDLGRAAAEALAATDKYSFIREIDAPLLHQWAATSGLSRQELEMIQPAYSYAKPGSLSAFVSLDRFEPQARASLSVAVPLQRGESAARGDLFVQDVFQDPAIRSLQIAPYVQGTVDLASSGPGVNLRPRNVELGAVGLFSGWLQNSSLQMRTGVFLPLPPFAGEGRGFVSHRLGDAVLDRPGTFGARWSLSLRSESDSTFWNDDSSHAFFWRIDLGLDLSRQMAGGTDLSSRAGVGLGWRMPHVAFTAEATTARAATAVTEEVARRFALAASARFILPEDLWLLSHLRPAVALTVPVGAQGGPVSVGLELLVLEYSTGSRDYE